MFDPLSIMVTKILVQSCVKERIFYFFRFLLFTFNKGMGDLFFEYSVTVRKDIFEEKWEEFHIVVSMAHYGCFKSTVK